jgi:resuscitation-promoting factor RpfB
MLADQGITVSDRDVVVPAPGSPLRAGEQVVVRFARPLKVTVDGAPHIYWTTALTVDSALRDLGVRADGARLSASRSETLGRAGMTVIVSHPKAVTLVADGRARQVTTTAATVSDLLAEQHVAPRPADQLSVLPAAPVVDGSVVALTRIERHRVLVTEPVAPATAQEPDAHLAQGQQHVVTPGRSGKRSAVYDVVLADGHETSRTQLSAVVVQQPVRRVVQVGTGPASAAGAAVPGADGLNWTALARCESGGNPHAVNPAGYYGLYQFSRSTWHAVGGSGLPSQASSAEQLYRAKLLYRRGGAAQWGCGRHLFD